MLSKICCGSNTNRKKTAHYPNQKAHYQIWVIYPQVGNQRCRRTMKFMQLMLIWCQQMHHFQLQIQH